MRLHVLAVLLISMLAVTSVAVWDVFAREDAAQLAGSPLIQCFTDPRCPIIDGCGYRLRGECCVLVCQTARLCPIYLCSLRDPGGDPLRAKTGAT
jgi:hypothetical protein